MGIECEELANDLARVVEGDAQPVVDEGHHLAAFGLCGRHIERGRRAIKPLRVCLGVLFVL